MKIKMAIVYLLLCILIVLGVRVYNFLNPIYEKQSPETLIAAAVEIVGSEIKDDEKRKQVINWLENASEEHSKLRSAANQKVIYTNIIEVLLVSGSIFNLIIKIRANQSLKVSA